MSGVRIAGPNHPARDQFGFGMNRRPRPNTSVPENLLLVGREVLVFGVAKAPNFVALNPLQIQIAKGFVLQLGASIAGFDQELGNRVLCYSGDSYRRPNTVAFDKTSDYLGPTIESNRFILTI